MSTPANNPAFPDAAPAPVARKKNNYGWIAFFVFIVIASLVVAGLMIWFNRSIQLTPELLETSWKLWKEKGPRNYQMTYTTRIDDARTADKFDVVVRGGKVQEVRLNGTVLQPNEKHDPRPFRSMDSLFHDIDNFMEKDSRPGQPRVYVVANFATDTGALRHYVRRVMGSTKRSEITVVKVEELPQ